MELVVPDGELCGLVQAGGYRYVRVEAVRLLPAHISCGPPRQHQVVKAGARDRETSDLAIRIGRDPVDA
jgi:hypothetical protein